MKLLGLLLIVFSIQAQAKLDVHEWGTFTSLIGSNGETQNGMYHEDEPLPSFVHGFGETISDDGTATTASADKPKPPPIEPPCKGKGCIPPEFIAANVISQKMETPVIYFYADKAMPRVSVNVKFPDGVLTETFPGPTKTFPSKNDKAVIGNGNTTFTIDILDKRALEVFPTVPAGNIYGHARNVAANIVKRGSEVERFIFYRGLGRFQPRISILSNKGNLTFQASAAAAPKAAFLVYVSPTGDAQMLEVTGFGGRISEVKSATINELRTIGSTAKGIMSGVNMRLSLENSLVTAGLFSDEAKAMVDTWESGYFKVPGTRFLYILPSAEVDQLLPLTIMPKPDSITRVFVGRIEVLLDTDEIEIMKDVLAQKQAYDVAKLGRFAEPMLRRVAAAYVEYNRANEIPVDKAVIADFQALVAKAARGSNAGTSVH